MTTQPSDWAVAPKFGEWLRGIYASERNPLRDGMYVRTIRRTGRCNPGTFYELTDGKGKFWQYPRQSVIRLDRARELDASGEALLSRGDGELSNATPRAAEAGDDTRRLDFIERTYSGMTNRERYLPLQMIWGKGANGRTLREAIDKYMRKDAAMGAVGAGGGDHG